MPLLSNKRTTAFPSLEAEARRRAALGDGDSWVFIAPNRIAQRRMERDMLEAARGRALPQLNILTLADLAGKLATTALPDFRVISDGESAVLIELSIRSLLDEHKLSFFEGAVESKNNGKEADSNEGNNDDNAFPIRRGTFELVVNTIRQLKESGVTAEHIKNDLVTAQSKGETTEVRRARDILAIYEAYQKRLQDHDLMDTHGQMLLVNERYRLSADGEKNVIRQDFHAAFPKTIEVYISGFYYLEPPSVALIARMAAIPNLSVAIELEEDKNNPNLFDGLIQLESDLLLRGFQTVHRARLNNDPLSDYIGRNIFRANNVLSEDKKIPTGVPVSKIQILTASDAASEVEEIARHIKLLYHSDPEIKNDLSKIVIATPASEAYTPLFEEIFRRHDIPVQIADRYHLDRSPLVLALIALLDAARTNLRKRELVRMLASPYFDFERRFGDSFDSANVLGVLSHYKQRGDWAAIVRSLNAHLHQIQSAKEASDDTRDFDRSIAEERKIQNALRDLNRIHILLLPLAGNLTPQEFCDSVRTLLAELFVPERIITSSRVTIAAGTLENDTRAYRALVKLLEELESLFHVMGIAHEKRKGSYFEHRLKAALIVTRYSPRARSHAVHITSLAQSISQPAKYLFLAGLVEGSFPAPYQPQVFLTSGLQKGERKQLLEDRVLFYQALTNFKEKLYLSYPVKSGGNAKINRSGFIDALDEVFTIGAAQKAEGIFSCNDLYHIVDRLDASAMVTFETDYPNARWLRTLKEQVPRSSTAILARLQMEDSIYRGAVEPGLLRDEERATLEKSRVWSVTQLELYATCPFRFFAHDVLSLGEEQEMEEGLDARDRGSALHEILRQFLIARRDRNLDTLQDSSDAKLSLAYTDVRAMAEDHFKTIASDHPFWRLDSELLLSDDKPGGSILWKFIKKEKELGEFELRPQFFEVSFGGAGRIVGDAGAPKTPIDSTLSRDEPMDLGGFQLRGKIDRIDIPKENEDGSRSSDAFAIIDYKSGKETPKWSEIERGLSLQLPLYLRVAEDLLRGHFPDLKGVAALYHKLMDEKSERKLGIALLPYAEKAFEYLGTKNKQGLLESSEQLADIIEQSVAKARTYVEGVSEGRFPLIEESLIKKCAYCPYGPVCRVHEAEEAGVLRS